MDIKAPADKETNRDDFITLYFGDGLARLWHLVGFHWHLVVVIDEHLLTGTALQSIMDAHLGQCRMVIESSE